MGEFGSYMLDMKLCVLNNGTKTSLWCNMLIKQQVLAFVGKEESRLLYLWENSAGYTEKNVSQAVK